MNKTEVKNCQNCKSKFTIEPEDFAFYEKVKVPAPTFCPDCREQRRIAFRNERVLYKRKCDLCGKEVVSRVSPDKTYPMYCKKCWWSDDWDPLQYGRAYDFFQPFFTQFRELLFTTPHISLLSSNMVDSEWVNQETDDKNCYLNVGGHFNEDSAYNTYELYGKDCFDNFWVLHSELCYQNINCERCYQILFSQDCLDCQDTILSNDCKNCMNIFGCAGLRNKKYHIFNKAYSKEEYQKFLKINPLGSHKNMKALKQKAEKVWRSMPHRDTFIVKSINCSGNFINESKNAYNCWYVSKVEESKNFYIAGWSKDCYDMTSFGYGELVYEGAHSVGLYNSKFFLFSLGGSRADVMSSSNLEYCHSVINSSNCFGCVNLKKQEYCILNKKYSKQEYKALVSQIKKQMDKQPYKDKKGRIYKYGEFFPIEFSSYGYNETAAMDYFPLTRAQALEQGYPWSDFETEVTYKFSDYKIPDNIQEVKDDILEKVLKGEGSGKAYQIIPMELQFYRRIGLPIPRRSPLQRHQNRIKQLLPRKLFDRSCQCGGGQSDNKVYQNTVEHFHKNDHCPNHLKTPYISNRPEIIYCEACYQQEVV